MYIIRKLGVLLGIVAAFAFPALALGDHGGGGQGSDDGQQQSAPAQGSGSGEDNDAQDDNANEQAGATEPGDDDDAADEAGEAHTTTQTTGSPASPAQTGRTESFQLRGTVVSVDPGTDQVTLMVTKTNHGGRGRQLVGQTLTFDLTGARLKVRDTNGDGMRDVNDVMAGDVAKLRARIAHPLPSTFTAPIAAQRFEDRSHDHATNDDN